MPNRITRRPLSCRQCADAIPSGVPMYADDMGPYMVCPSCDGSQDITPATEEN